MSLDQFNKEFPNGIPLKKNSKGKRSKRLPMADKEKPLVGGSGDSKKRNKYGNIPVEMGGIKFDSEREESRYVELSIMLKLGEIENLELQPCFVLADSVFFEEEGKHKKELRYFADFTYYCKKRKKQIIEDVKSEATAKNPVYRMKKHLMKSQLGLEITEVF